MDVYETLYESGGTLPVRLEATGVTNHLGETYRHHRMVVGDGRPAAVVAAIDGESIVLVRQFRRSVGGDTWELPRGSSDVEDAVDPATGQPVDEYGDEALIRAGLRELREETGLAGEDPCVIGRYVADTAVFPQRAAIVHCTVHRDATPDDTDGEVAEVRWVALEELWAMVARGEIIDSHTLAGLAFLQAWASAGFFRVGDRSACLDAGTVFLNAGASTVVRRATAAPASLGAGEGSSGNYS